MKFLRRYFKRYPTRENLASIAQLVALGLQDARNEWVLDVCTKQLQSLYQTLEGSKLKTRTEISGEILLALKSFQLCTIPSFLESQHIRKSQHPFFEELVAAMVCGTDAAAVGGAAEEFARLAPDMRDFHLARRVAEYLTGNCAPLIEAALLLGMVPAFTIFSRMAVVRAFQDKVAESELDKQIDRWIAGLNDHYLRVWKLATQAADAA
jgi:hypothetical protein